MTDLEIKWCVARDRGSLEDRTWKLAWEEAARRRRGCGVSSRSHVSGGVAAFCSTLHPSHQLRRRLERYQAMVDEPALPLPSDGLQPGYDIFCTLHNDALHATTLCSKLDAAQQEIRLVKLWPGTGDDVIECTLLAEAPLLNLKAQYTAPSYCAGSATNTEPIVLNGTPFNVFANLAHALKEVRHFRRATYGDRVCLS
jgi:hypothetical protein